MGVTIVVCPTCQTRLKVRASHLQAARCPHCGGSLDGGAASVVGAEDERPQRKRNRKKKHAADLTAVRQGLVFHLVVPFLAHAGVGFALAALAVSLFRYWLSLIGTGFVAGVAAGVGADAPQAPTVESAWLPATFFMPGVVVVLLASIGELPGSLQCLRLKDGQARALILASIGIRVLTIAAGIAFLTTSGTAKAVLLVLFFLTLFASWSCWLGAVQRMATVVKSDLIAADLMVSYWMTLVGSLLTIFFMTLFGSLIVVGVLGVLSMRLAFALLLMVGCVCFGALVKTMTIIMGGSFVEGLLAPIGYFWTSRYVYLIRDLRDELRDAAHT